MRHPDLANEVISRPFLSGDQTDLHLFSKPLEQRVHSLTAGADFVDLQLRKAVLSVIAL